MRLALLLALLLFTPSLAEGVGNEVRNERSAPGDATQKGGEVRAGGRGQIGPAWTDKRNPIVQTFGGKRLDL